MSLRQNHAERVEDGCPRAREVRRRLLFDARRRVGLYRLHTWGIEYLSDASESAALVHREATANAVTHGRSPGRDLAAVP
ncbi:hypothetical protein SCYAM73S_07683 [Streptomyces cyaneofuscatus]